jgi:hypothetical protein
MSRGVRRGRKGWLGRRDMGVRGTGGHGWYRETRRGRSLRYVARLGTGLSRVVCGR